jgi:peptide-methionine (R)-S-oxide reductase
MQDKTASQAATKIVKSEAEWRELLMPEQFRVTRKHGTEPAFSHPYHAEKRPGTYRCVCCGETLFTSAAKFDSGTGWPSFTRPASEAAISTQEDRSLAIMRTEVRCARCDAHLGHVFSDGPLPTGLRYCINGQALRFEPEIA